MYPFLQLSQPRGPSAEHELSHDSSQSEETDKCNAYIKQIPIAEENHTGVISLKFSVNTNEMY